MQTLFDQQDVEGSALSLVVQEAVRVGISDAQVLVHRAERLSGG